ncbi:unnamed protein product [Meganyctiphanes norvegica]|uniref:Iodothyronine deiodinase n=1 Tax=Meganyctiphanes norvegica TaxID=48144 RepID=A0AAV2SIC2_MEGNR
MRPAERLLASLKVPSRLVIAFLWNIFVTLKSVLGTSEVSEHFTITYVAVGDVNYFWQRLRNMVRNIFQEVMADTSLHGKSPNPTMLRLDTNSKCQLLDLAKAGRPLVINFGSCT